MAIAKMKQNENELTNLYDRFYVAEILNGMDIILPDGILLPRIMGYQKKIFLELTLTITLRSKLILTNIGIRSQFAQIKAILHII